MAGLDFDEGVARQLEVVYGRRDIVRRRELVRAAVAASAGEDVADVGCGPGFTVADLLEDVGPTGSVTGLDLSAPMLAIAAGRAGDRANVAFHEADACALPLPDASVDAAVSVQVLEYVADLDGALAELHRIVRPGGRVVVWDVDWATVSLHSEDPGRSARVLAAWDEHLAHPSLPRALAPALRAAGFTDVVMAAHPFATTEYTPESYGVALLPLVESFVVERGFDAEEAAAWAAELRALGDRGEFFCSVTQFCFTARR